MVGNQPPPSGGHQLGELATGVQPEAGIPAHTWQARRRRGRWRRGLGVRKSRPAVVFFFKTVGLLCFFFWQVIIQLNISHMKASGLVYLHNMYRKKNITECR